MSDNTGAAAPLSVPELPPGCTVAGAAMAYAAAGWYVLPADGKNPGQYLGAGWQHQSSRDPAVIAGWWQRWPGAGIGLHTGRSGAVVFDVDNPANVPPLLRQHAAGLAFQSTRSNDPERGHYVAACPPMAWGCSLGDLRIDPSWGEVKSGNSVIIAAPSPHPKAAEGGRYAWARRDLPPLPGVLAACLRPPGATHQGGDEAAVLAFLAGLPEHPAARCEEVTKLLAPLPDPGGRYEAVRHRTMRLARLGDQGHYGAPVALDELQAAYGAALAGEGRSPEREYTTLLAGAVAEVLADPTPAAEKGCCPATEGAVMRADLAAAGFNVAAIEARLMTAEQPPAPLPVNQPGQPAQGQGQPASRLDQLRAGLLDWDELSRLPLPEPVVTGWLYRNTLAWIKGEPGGGKSLAAVDITGCVKTGKDWHGHQVTQGPVLYLVLEGVQSIRQRAEAWRVLNGARPLGKTFSPLRVNLMEPAEAEAVAWLAYEMQPVLIVVDTQARATPGGEENSSRDMGVFVSHLEAIREACGACVLVVHHEPRSGMNLRGSTALEGAASTIIDATKDGLTVTLRTDAKAGGRQKDAPERGPFNLTMASAGPGMALKLDVSLEALTKISENGQAILDLLAKTGELSTPKITDLTGIARSTVQREVYKLLDLGRVLRNTVGKADYWVVVDHNRVGPNDGGPVVATHHDQPNQPTTSPTDNLDETPGQAGNGPTGPRPAHDIPKPAQLLHPFRGGQEHGPAQENGTSHPDTEQTAGVVGAPAAPSGLSAGEQAILATLIAQEAARDRDRGHA